MRAWDIEKFSVSVCPTQKAGRIYRLIASPASRRYFHLGVDLSWWYLISASRSTRRLFLRFARPERFELPTP